MEKYLELFIKIILFSVILAIPINYFLTRLLENEPPSLEDISTWCKNFFGSNKKELSIQVSSLPVVTTGIVVFVLLSAPTPFEPNPKSDSKNSINWISSQSKRGSSPQANEDFSNQSISESIGASVWKL